MRFLLSSIFFVSLFYPFAPASNSGTTGTVSITVVPRFSGQPLVLGKQLYHSSNGDSLYLDVLRFYLSGLELRGKGAAMFKEKDSCHLVDAEESGTQTILLENVPAGRYDTICFYIGTDSLTNVSGAMGGDLDPTLGMYWAWNSGYINVKLEGRSDACKTLHHAFLFHIGGYMPPHPTVRALVLPLHAFQVRDNAVSSIRLEADLERFFSQISLGKTNEVMIPSKTAAQMADFFQSVFSVR